MPDLIEGTELSAIWGPGPNETYARVGRPSANPAVRIRVTMENGQGAMVPWARVSFQSGQAQLYNLALAEGVEFA